MVKTRRKSKAAAAAAAAAAATAAAEMDHDGASTQGTEDICIPFTIPIPVDIDIDALAHFIPDVSFTHPTPDTIVAVYRLLLAQAEENNATQRDLEDVRATVDRKDIELDQAVQDGESKSKDLESALESVQNELNTVKNERDQILSSKNALEAQIASLSTSRDTSSTELDQLRHRIDECEREKRDLIGVVSRLKEDATQRDEEVQTLRTNLRQARQEYQAVESQVRELRSAETSNRFKIDTLSQQLTLAQNESQRITTELTAKSDEYARYRRSKHAEFVQLQAAHDALTEKHASIQSSFKAMQSAHEAQTYQLTQQFSRVQDLQGKLAEQEAAFSTEVSGLKRLVTIMEEREKQAKEIVEGIEREWAGVGDRAESREAALRADADRERRAREETEKRLEQLETVLERMNRGELPVAGRGTPLPGTPGRSQNTPDAMFGLSPTVAMVSKVQRSGKTFTEVYADYVRLEEEYAKKCAEYDHMDRTLSDVLAQIEERAPILAQQRGEYERLQVEATQLSAQLSATLAERDANAASLQDISQKLKKSHEENDLLQHQLTDLGRQIQTLLKELGRRDDQTIPADEILDEMEPLPANNIEAVITNNLVMFRSIPALQEQNQRLLKIVREMGAKMEAEEREYRAALEQEQCEAVREAHEAIQELVTQLDRQKKSSETTIQAYMKERDTLKAMLARSERVAPPPPYGATPAANVNGDLNGAGPGDLAAELADAQMQFESYRQEMGVDSSKLRDDLSQAHRDLGQANITLAKANAKIDYLTERHRIIQEQLTLQSRDLDNLTARNRQLYDDQARHDIERDRVIDELAMTKGDLEQLRNEAANLRAEKKIWESVQSRLVEDNRSLSVERGQLADLVANVQRMHNDLEQSGENHRKRLEMQVQMMESQMQDLKTQLSQERETIRHITLQRDIDTKDLQARLDKTSEQLAQARESFVGAETSKTHLQERVEQLTRQLQGNEEKLAVYERRSSGTVVTVPSPDLPREQQLEQEVAELRSALKIAQVDLASAKIHMQQFQEISQANEAALAALNATHDQYKADAEAQIARHELGSRSLEEKLRVVGEELNQAKAKVNEVQQTLETERSAWTNDKKILEGTIVDLSTSERTSENDRNAHEREIRVLEERAVAAEDRYAREVVTHAEALKTIENLRQQIATVQASARENLAEGASAQARLEASKGSWRQQKEALEKEIADLNARCKDLGTQNTLLYQHLDTVSSQAARIRQVADSSAESTNGEAGVSGDNDTKLAELRAVVAYLRKEKEIVDLQLELCKQETVRLKAQIDHLNQSLQEARNTLSEERERAIQAATSDAQHAEMLERINQLNILRESNATLRTDCENYAKRARELDTRLKALSTELDPAKEEARMARAELQARDAQIALLESESKRWQERNAQLLTKYDRIDPAEVQSLRDEIESLKTQKTEAEKRASERATETSESTTRIQALEDTIRKHREAAKETAQSFRGRLGALNQEKSNLNQTINELQEQIKTITAERDALRAGANSDANKELNAQLEALRQEKSNLEKALADERAKVAAQPTPSPDQIALIAALQAERDRLLVEKETLTKASGAEDVDTLKSQWEQEKAEISKALDEATTRAKAADEELKKATNYAQQLKHSNDKFQVKIQDLQRARDRANTELTAAVEKANAATSAGSTARSTEVLTKQHAKELEDLKVQLTAQHAKELENLKTQLTKHETTLKEAVDAAIVVARDEALRTSSSDPTRAAIDAAIAAHEQKSKSKHDEEIDKAVERGRMEQAAKIKVKDAQVVRAQAKVKELESQIMEWVKLGLVTDPKSVPVTASTVPPASVASTSNLSVPPRPPPATATAAATAPTSTSTQPATLGSSVTLATAPSTGAPHQRKQPMSGAVPLSTGLRRGRGTGVPRGAAGLNIRGRGGAPSPTAITAPTQSENLSIFGAASKRGREEDPTSDGDSLAKRIKPAEDATGNGDAPTAGAKPPVQLRRPQP